jgi:flavin-binding protein dodecin
LFALGWFCSGRQDDPADLRGVDFWPGRQWQDAIQSAISRASKTLRNLRWFEVVETRGNIDNGKLSYQVTLKVGFTMEG